MPLGKHRRSLDFLTYPVFRRCCGAQSLSSVSCSSQKSSIESTFLPLVTYRTGKRWRGCRRSGGGFPNTEIDIVLIENGPRAGEYLVSAATIDRLPEFYNRVKDLPYKPGPAQQLAEVYRSISHGGSATIYEAFLSSPVGLSYMVPPRWMLNLPDWARARVASVATWQWLGLGLGFLVGGLIIFGGHRSGTSPR